MNPLFLVLTPFGFLGFRPPTDILDGAVGGIAPPDPIPGPFRLAVIIRHGAGVQNKTGAL